MVIVQPLILTTWVALGAVEFDTPFALLMLVLPSENIFLFYSPA